ncbi:MAG: hypothetical protein JW712_05805 [Dehalococcoidales bacterium]|nr:hypothetical protein [Dehalococcoidales bacterium]
MYNSIALEDAGKPTVILCNYGFVTDAYSAASGKGLPGIRPISENVPCESTIAADIEAGVLEAMDTIIDALTRPLTEQEINPKPMDTEEKSRIVFKGTLEEVNRFFYRRGWTDGMPIIPPTEEAVAEMLTGTDLPADHVVTKIIPRLGKATVEKIAVNAVMAGALPTYMPVLIAACRAVMEPKTRFDTFEVSTGSWAPCYIINGSIRKEININCSSGALSPGDMANATIGRAMGLIVKNIGGARKAIEDMGVLGNPSKYSLVIGENEEECPWEPFQTGRGFTKEDNTLTVFYPNSYCQNIPMQTDDKGILQAMINNARNGGMACFLINPPHSKYLANEGWTREKVVEYIAENAVTSTGPGVPIGDEDGSVRKLFWDNESLIVVCTGGPGVFMGVLTSAGGGGMRGFGNKFHTVKIELPSNWDKLVAKYKNIVPNYVKY